MANFKALLESGRYSDLIISCNGVERRVHRAIVSTSGVIDLSDHDVEALNCLLEFLYTADYNEYKSGSARSNPDSDDVVRSENNAAADDTESVVSLADGQVVHENCQPSAALPVPSQATNAIMYAMGEQYDIGPLKNLAKQKFASHEFIEWSDQLPEVLELVYTTTPDSDRPLRDLTRDFCGPHANSLIQDQAVTHFMLREPSFGLDLCRGGLKHLQEGWDADRETVSEGNEEIERLCSLVTAAEGRTAKLDNDLQELAGAINSIDQGWKCCKDASVTVVLDGSGLPSIRPTPLYEPLYTQN
ncbi:hypothetical protein MMC27_002894 [Xylographa pallens]|nr:hypothetical protein [Xylographa pallens]